MPHSQNQKLLSLVSIYVAMIGRTLLQTFSTIVTTVVSPHANEVNYIECVHIDYSVKIMNLIDSRNIYLLLHSKCHIYRTLI